MCAWTGGRSHDVTVGRAHGAARLFQPRL
jgi:hypothetical protein